VIASCEGVADTATVEALPRPTADWSQVSGEWTTYQGNATHTGYLPAVVDPVGFTHRWTTTLEASGAPINPVTAGGGSVFASTSTYFGRQILTTLDAATGAVRWSYDFGAIHSVDPPAYANGNVYVATGGHNDSFIWSFTASTGTQRFHTAYGNQWSRWFAPVIQDTTLYMAGGYYGGMYAFSTVDGQERWFVGLNQYDEFTPAVANGRVYAYTGSYTPEVTVADAATGAVLDHIADPEFDWGGWSMGIAPVVEGNRLYATNGGRLIAFDLGQRTIAWQVKTGTIGGQVSLANGVLYVRNGPTIDARSASDGNLLWSLPTPLGAQGTMLVTRNLLFLNTGDQIWAIDLAAHLPVWSYPAGGHVSITPDGLMLLGRPDGKVTALQIR
jgi:hypothetical protein